IHQPLEVMAESRRRDVDLVLNLTSRRSTLVALHHEAQDAQANWVAQRSKLLCVALELGHSATSTIFEITVQPVRARMSQRSTAALGRAGSSLLHGGRNDEAYPVGCPGCRSRDRAARGTPRNPAGPNVRRGSR